MEQNTERVPGFIRKDAYPALAKLAELMSIDKGVKVALIDAASIAIKEKERRMVRKMERKAQAANETPRRVARQTDRTRHHDNTKAYRNRPAYPDNPHHDQRAG